MKVKYFISDISQNKYPDNEKVLLSLIRHGVLDLIKQEYPFINESMCISMKELDEYRQKFIENMLKKEFDELSSLESEVIDKIKNNALVSSDLEENFQGQLTMGQRIADKVASFGGSWKFIITFSGIILVWIAINVFSFFFKSFDPYPFILLNLLLSCLAAFQAPIIMMSQNRQEEKDRSRAREDYKVNLKSELEIRILQEKLDHLILIQQQRLFEIQNIQVEMLKEITTDISVLKKIKEKK